MVNFQEFSEARLELGVYLQHLLDTSYMGGLSAHDLARLDIDNASHDVQTNLRARPEQGFDLHSIDFILPTSIGRVRFSTGNLFPINWIRSPLITLEYILTYAAAHQQCLRKKDQLSDEALESMAKVNALFDGLELPLSDPDEHLRLANMFYDDRPWFYRLSTVFEVIR